MIPEAEIQDAIERIKFTIGELKRLREANRELRRVLQSFVNITTIREDAALDDIVKQAENILTKTQKK